MQKIWCGWSISIISFSIWVVWSYKWTCILCFVYAKKRRCVHFYALLKQKTTKTKYIWYLFLSTVVIDFYKNLRTLMFITTLLLITLHLLFQSIIPSPKYLLKLKDGRCWLPLLCTWLDRIWVQWNATTWIWIRL